MIRIRQKIGKYRIDERYGTGGFANVYKAYDTVEGIHVALKVPHTHLMTKDMLQDFRKEARITASLDHPNILPVKTAEFINDHFIIVYPLGKRTLEDRMKRRMSLKACVDLAVQMLDAVAYAHEQKVIHCDLKPANFILFPGDRLRLADFGIAKISARTMTASGSGTVGYVAPEQAMGKPSRRSDVFSLGLIISEMFTGILPEWPFDWPPSGLKERTSDFPAGFMTLLKRALTVDERKRFETAAHMREAFLKLKPKILQKKRKTPRNKRTAGAKTRDWRRIRWKEFQRRFGKQLETRHACGRCQGPVSEAMCTCPWCGTARKKIDVETDFPCSCKRCGRGMKLDWAYCAHCYGKGYDHDESRVYTDKRYAGRCANSSCDRRELMPFMRYCPWCRTKVRRAWKIEGDPKGEKCTRCRWGVLGEFWDYCPWCARNLHT